MIRAVIIDDEKHSVETLRWKLERYCPEVEVVASFTESPRGLAHLREDPPDLLFLDIAMPMLSGFDVLEELGHVPFDVIFTTAYDDHGIQAIKFSALDYLLKPIQNQELREAVAKFKAKGDHHVPSGQLAVLMENLRNEDMGGFGKIALATKESIEFVEPEEIVLCTSDSNYTMVYLNSGRKKLISRTLKEFEEMLGPLHFFRAHHSHLVNLQHIREYIRTDGGYLVLSNKMQVPVSRSRKESLMAMF